MNNNNIESQLYKVYDMYNIGDEVPIIYKDYEMKGKIIYVTKKYIMVAPPPFEHEGWFFHRHYRKPDKLEFYGCHDRLNKSDYKYCKPIYIYHLGFQTWKNMFNHFDNLIEYIKISYGELVEKKKEEVL